MYQCQSYELAIAFGCLILSYICDTLQKADISSLANNELCMFYVLMQTQLLLLCARQDAADLDFILTNKR